MTDRPLVIYHWPCLDGFTAAWCAWEHFDGVVDLHPASYGDEPPDVTGRRVYVLDFSYPRTVLEEMHSKASSLLVLDHHRSAQEALEGLPFATFDMERSGAGMAWDHFKVSRRRPWLVDYIEDRDLWRWKLADSRAVNAYLRSLEPTMEQWRKLGMYLLGPARFPEPKLVECGQAILRWQTRVVMNTVERAGWGALLGSASDALVPIVNAGPELGSEIGNELALLAPFGVVWSHGANGYYYQLRSSPQRADALDVSKVASAFGGGGHRHAAGFASTEIAHKLFPESTLISDVPPGEPGPSQPFEF